MAESDYDHQFGNVFFRADQADDPSSIELFDTYGHDLEPSSVARAAGDIAASAAFKEDFASRNVPNVLDIFWTK